jgi:hypothetical protein
MSKLTGMGLVLGSLMFASAANATVILDGSSSGTFTNYSTTSGNFLSGSTSTELLWGATPSSDTLSTVSTSFNATGAVTDLHLAELQMQVYNNPTCASCGFQYNVAFNVTTPSGALTTYSFTLDLGVSGTGVNSTNDITQLAILNAVPPFPISIDLGGGYTLTDFGFVAAGGTYSNGTWTVTGHNGTIADLFLVGDITFSQIQQVPEPASIALLGSGLLALSGLFWRRRRPRLVE